VSAAVRRLFVVACMSIFFSPFFVDARYCTKQFLQISYKFPTKL